ncbi:hypothetical protein J5X98_24195 [Leptothermofonsia sichuanensis E412]|jgi:hypothetical protein|uniref:hypothetical protein n=1 Tax=Leptothermofonsia sichuanensis TaxID=2917832 RepID=UPI001CA67959|nr:hypothetical protein [Leptothermofonsia sichuanensis]QZZ20324.1 hypothetical protein J5X98_24195 [Leptothermofonsia sichuanensis E412]
MLKHKKLVLATLLAIAGGAYFSAYSSLETHFFLSAWVILAFQTVACLYLIYLYWSGRFKGTSRYQKQRQEDEF